jgi:thioredoxin reductase (NADPH)
MPSMPLGNAGSFPQRAEREVMQADNSHQTDVVIVGAGPVGLFAVFELGMLKIRAHVVDALDMTGGQCQALYPEKPIYDIPGFPRIDATQLIERLVEQATPFEPVYHLGQRVERVERQGEGWLVETAKGTRIQAKAIIIAGGVGAFGPNRPPLAGIAEYEGRSVHYLVKRREDFRGKRVVIAGGGDSALDWTLSLAEVAAKIYVVHRRAKFRGAPESVARMMTLAEQGEVVELVVPYQLHGLEGHDGQLEAVIVSSLENGERRLEADSLLAFFGLSMQLGPIAKWGLQLDHHLIRIDPSTCQTSEPGIFAIGDITSYPGKLKLILCGFSEAAMAAHAIHHLVYPDQELHWEYSTTKGLPTQS